MKAVLFFLSGRYHTLMAFPFHIISILPLLVHLYFISFIKMYPALFRSGGHDKGAHHQAHGYGSRASGSPD